MHPRRTPIRKVRLCMEAEQKDTLAAPTFLEILETLSLEEQRAAVAWLEKRVAELGCIVPHRDISVPELFVQFLAHIDPKHFLN